MNEVKQALKKHKILLIITLIACILCVSVDVFAAESSFVITEDAKPSAEELKEAIKNTTGDSFSLSSDGNYVFIASNVELAPVYYLFVATSSTAEDWYFSTSASGELILYGGYGNTFWVASFQVDYSDTWTCLGCTKYGGSNSNASYKVLGSADDNYKILGNGIDVKVCGEVFQATPLVKQAQQSTLVGGLTSELLVKSLMKEIAGSIPLVIGFLTLVLALWKGWKVLVRSLRTV